MADREVALVNSDGQIGTLPADQAQAAIAAGGARPASPDEWAAGKAIVHQQTQQEKYGSSPLDMEGAKLAGVARGLTLGLSDPLLLKGAEALGGRSAREGLRERLSAYREVSPYLSGEGEAVGMLLPTLLGSPGAAVAAGDSLAARALVGGIRAVGAPARLLGAAGEAAEAGIARTALAGSEGLAARIAGQAARGAVEGGIYGAGQAVDESALGDQQLTAEKLLAGMGANAALGGIIGGGAGIAGELASATKRAVMESLADNKPLAEWFESMRNTKAFKASGGNYAEQVRAADRLPGGVQKIGADIAEQVPLVTRKPWARTSPQEVADALETRRQQVGQEIGALRDSFDHAGKVTGIGPSVDRFLAQAQSEAVAPMLGLPGKTNDALSLNAYLEDFARKAGPEPTFTKWNEFRQALDRDIHWAQRGGDPKTDALIKIRQLMEGEHNVSAEEAANAIGGTALLKHRELKSLYQSMNFGAEMARNGLQRTTANRGMSLTDTMAALTGLAKGGPLGATALGAANKFIRSRGDMIMTEMFGGLARLAKVERATQVVDAHITRAVKGLFRTPAETTIPASVQMFGRGKARERAIRETVDRIAAMTADPSKFASAGVQSQALEQHAPNTAAALAVATANVAGFLAQKLPQGFSPLAFGQAPDVKYDEAEIAKFARTLRAATDPMSVLDDMKGGTLSREAVEAVKALYPKLYTDIQSRVMQAAAQPRNGKGMSYETRVKLGMLLDVPADPTLDPKFVNAIQSTFAQQAQPAPQRAAAGGGAATVLADQSATESDRLAQE